MKKNWVLGMAGILFGIGLVFAGCGKQEAKEEPAPPASVAEAPFTSSEKGEAEKETVAPTPSGEEAQPGAAQAPESS